MYRKTVIFLFLIFLCPEIGQAKYNISDIAVMSTHIEQFDFYNLPTEHMLDEYPVERNWYEDLIKASVPYDNTEKAMFTYAMILQAADVATTIVAMDKGAVEANPLFGEDPDKTTVIAAKLVFCTALWMSTNYIDDHEARKWMLGVVDVIYTGVIINNLSVVNGL